MENYIYVNRSEALRIMEDPDFSVTCRASSYPYTNYFPWDAEIGHLHSTGLRILLNSDAPLSLNNEVKKEEK